MGSKIDPAELRTTNDLLKDFAANPDLSAEDVCRTSWSRFNILEQVPLHEILQKKDGRVFCLNYNSSNRFDFGRIT